MTLDPRFVAAKDLEQYFVDKDTGFPLDGGIVTFYSDVNRTVKKPVYQLTGSPPNYSFSVLLNPSVLSSVGTFQDSMNNNIVPYYFPYEGTPDDSTGVVELYYVTVYSNDGDGNPAVEQFTREAWPPNATSGSTPGGTSDDKNFIPNGQFLSHTDIISATQPPVVAIDGQDVQYIAQGGWSFRRSTGGTSLFNNSFSKITTAISGLNDFPRYAFNFVCTSFNASDQVRDLVIEWQNVYKFSSGNPIGDQDYTYFFAGESGDASTYVFEVILTYYYGTGGSPSPTETMTLGTFSISPGYSYSQLNIAGFPEPTGTVGSNNDDTVSISLRGPASSFTVQLTDLGLLLGNVVIDQFPVQTNAQMLSEGVAGWMPQPNPNGSDLYLTLRLTPKGMVWDESEIGSYIALSNEGDFVSSVSTTTNLLLTDGKSYLTTGYSPLGIPYSRLQAKYWDSTYKLPIYGTGPEFVQSYIPSGTTNIFRMTTNQPGSQSATVDGSSPTGFTFTPLYTGTSNYNVTSFINDLGINPPTVMVFGNAIGAVTAADAGTSGFTVAHYRNDTLIRQLFSVEVPALPAAGTYFTFSSVAGVGSPYYVWFKVNGAGSDPAPGGTGILIPILSTYSTADVASLIRECLSGFQAVNVSTIAASGLSAGDFFKFFANSVAYGVYYRIANAGAAPVGITGIPVNLTGTETSAQVASATLLAINNFMFATPNTHGVILKGWSNGATSFPFDQNFDARFSFVDTYFGDKLGTYQSDELMQHSHNTSVDYYSATVSPSVDQPLGTNEPATILVTEDYTSTTFGGVDTRPLNISVQYAVRY